MSGVHSAPVRESCTTAWRWVNVPRRESGRTCEPVRPLDEERAEGEKFAKAPVDVAFVSHGVALVKERHDFLMDGEALWRGGMGFTDALKHLGATAVAQPTIVPASSCWEEGTPRLSAALPCAVSALFSTSRTF